MFFFSLTDDRPHDSQLTAFEVWLDMSAGSGAKEAPEQLPVVLQVLLSQQHRQRALEHLDRFLALGPWAVYKALSGWCNLFVVCLFVLVGMSSLFCH